MKKINVVFSAAFLIIFVSLVLMCARFSSFDGGRVTVKDGKLAATADLGYSFSTWSSGETNPEIGFTMNNVLFAYPIFEKEAMEFPVISIVTEDNAEIRTKENYVNCFVSLSNASEEYLLYDVGCRIKLRGNSTLSLDKKPYKLKFDEKVGLLGYDKAKEWTLLANHMDYSLARNYLTYTVAQALDGLRYTTTVSFVDVYVNGEYMGVYTLCEQVEVGKNRVNISDDLGTTDTGYLIEMDSRAPSEGELDRDYFISTAGQPYAIKSPDTEDEGFTAEHNQFIKSYVTESLAALDSGEWSRVCEFLDVESFADGYILDELFKPMDIGFSSFYMYKEAGGKICRGPIWDYDLSSGNSLSDQANNTSFNYSGITNPWYEKLLKYDEFRSIICARLNEKSDEITAIMETCFATLFDSMPTLLRNFDRWDILGSFTMEWNSPDACAIENYEDQLIYLESWLKDSLEGLLNNYAE